MELTENALTLLEKRYLRKNEYGVCETLNEFWNRVSMGSFAYRQMLSSLKFLPNSPTLFNLGTGQGTLSACFKFDVADTMFDDPSGIMPVANKAAGVLKYGGGVGYYLGGLRPEGALVNSTHGNAMGPLGVMRIYHRLAKEITQGGKRDAAQMAILDYEHPDIDSFITCKDDAPQSLNTFNISVAISDEDMKSEVAQYRRGSRSGKLSTIAHSAWSTGDPGLYFKSAAERDNPTPWLGTLTGTNPCGEVPLLDNEPCNLGSINLAAHVSNGTMDIESLLETVELAVQYLDDVLDRNEFSDPKITEAALRTRKLGLGVCGLADALAMMGTHYDSAEAVNWSDRIMHEISVKAKRTSERLGEKRGHAPCFEGKNSVRRNATVTCIAPTGSIAILMGVSSGIEPFFALENTRTMGDGTVMTEKHDYGDHVPHVSHEIEWQWHVEHQAAFQRHTDLAVSKTINMPNSATPEDVFEAYVMMWESGCKGGTIFRDGCREDQVLRISDAVVGVTEENDRLLPVPPLGFDDRRRLPNRRRSWNRKFNVAEAEGYFTVGEYHDGTPGELFIKMAKQGTEVNALYDSIAIAVSLGLQYGVPLQVLVDKFSYMRSLPYGLTSDPDLPTATSVLDYIFRRLGLDYSTESTTVQNGDVCPECGARCIYVEGCVQCADRCGWSRC